MTSAPREQQIVQGVLCQFRGWHADLDKDDDGMKDTLSCECGAKYTIGRGQLLHVPQEQLRWPAHIDDSRK